MALIELPPAGVVSRMYLYAARAGWAYRKLLINCARERTPNSKKMVDT